MQPEPLIETVPADRLPAVFRDLAWEVFFAGRGRGVSLDAHFPWLAEPGRGALAVTARVGGAAAAMLVVRPGVLDVGGRRCPIAAIGLVCTAPAWRGHGLASQLLDAATAEACTGADVALLWTGQHGFYERLGFRTADPALTGTARPTPRCEGADRSERAFAGSAFDAGTIFAGSRGIPPFATRIEVLEAADGRAGIAIGEAAGSGEPILLDWSGASDAALDLIDGLGAATIRWNAAVGDPLTAAALHRGYTFDLRPANLAMWRPLSPPAPSLAELAAVPIPLLDRF